MKELIEIQSRLKAPKSKYNSFGKYNYRSLEDIFEAVKPLLKEYNCSLVVSDDIAMMGEWHYVKATATLTNSEGQTAFGVGFAREDPTKSGMSLGQITGSNSSYARKYALNGLFLIDDTKDPDTDEYKVESDAKAKKEKKDNQAKIDEACAAMRAVKSREELEKCWKKYSKIVPAGVGSDFMTALQEMAQQYPKAQ